MGKTTSKSYPIKNPYCKQSFPLFWCCSYTAATPETSSSRKNNIIPPLFPDYVSVFYDYTHMEHICTYFVSVKLSKRTNIFVSTWRHHELFGITFFSWNWKFEKKKKMFRLIFRVTLIVNRISFFFFFSENFQRKQTKLLKSSN